MQTGFKTPFSYQTGFKLLSLKWLPLVKCPSLCTHLQIVESHSVQDMYKTYTPMWQYNQSHHIIYTYINIVWLYIFNEKTHTLKHCTFMQIDDIYIDCGRKGMLFLCKHSWHTKYTDLVHSLYAQEESKCIHSGCYNVYKYRKAYVQNVYSFKIFTSVYNTIG